ncbi:MAG: MFS transporter, partial [Candidatus Methylomirabilales bacterium]
MTDSAKLAKGKNSAGTSPRPGRANFWILVGGFLTAYDGSAVALALPSIMGAYETDIRAAQWVIIGFLGVTTALLIPIGDLADRWGRRRLYGGGLICLAVGALGSAMAPTFRALVAWRVVQGGGAAAVAATTQAILASEPTVGASAALGQLHAAIGLGLLAGPILGGWLVAEVGWPAIFLVEAVLALGAWGMCLQGTPEVRRPATHPFDLPGALLLAGVTGSLILSLAMVGRLRGALSVASVLAVIGGASLLGFVARESRTTHPLIPRDLFRNRACTVGLTCALLTFVAMASNMFLMPIFLQTALGLPSPSAGILLATVPLVIILAAPLSGAWGDRAGPRLPATLGLVCVTGGIGLMWAIEPHSGVWAVLGALTLYGIGAALFQSPNNSAVLRAVPEAQRGKASGILATARNLGLATGVAVAALVLSWDGSGPHGMAVAAFQRAFAILMAVAAGATLLSWFRGGGRKRRQQEPSA